MGFKTFAAISLPEDVNTAKNDSKVALADLMAHCIGITSRETGDYRSWSRRTTSFAGGTGAGTVATGMSITDSPLTV